MTKDLKISIILSLAFIGLIRFRPLWERTPGGFWNILFLLLIAVLFFWITIKVLIEILRFNDQKKALTFKSIVPVGILVIALADGWYYPLNINLEKLHGEVLLRACREGTQNQVTLKLREGNMFDIHSTGVFFYDEFFTGIFEKRADTIFMHFDNKKPNVLTDTLLILNEDIFAVENDTIRETFFYLGYCKGLN